MLTLTLVLVSEWISGDNSLKANWTFNQEIDFDVHRVRLAHQGMFQEIEDHIQCTPVNFEAMA